MTITYTHEVANARLGGFSNLLLRWRGSVYKLFYKEFVIYIILYTILSICYRYIDVPEFKNYFEKLCLQFQSYTDLVPISFVLGFYVSMVVGRWWQQYLYIPWPDRLMVIVAANVHGSDQRGRLIRRTLMRYLSLAQVLTYRSISTAVFKRFPTMQHVIDAGFMTQAEYKQYENVKTENAKYFVPCVWFSNLLSKVRQEGRIYDDMTYHTILKELNDFRGSCGMLFSYDWISIPLVYTQVVTVAVYVFFMSTLLSRQYLDIEKEYPGHEVDLYVPIFTICQFFFYVGWLKVAEQLINPFGEDDDDFEVNYIIDRNLELSLLTVDSMYLNHPKLEKDRYWNNPNPSIPYTAASANHKVDAFLGSTIDMSLGRQEMQFIDQPQPELMEPNMPHWDKKHNYIDFEKQTLLEPPPSYPSEKQAPLRSVNPMNFLKRFTGRGDKETQFQKSSLNFLPPRVKMETKEDKKVKEENADESQSNSSDDSDVGDGGGSENDDTADNKNGRRSSLSSIDEEVKEDDGKKDTDDQQKFSEIRKHSIGESEDRPCAKKPKNSQVLTPAVNNEARPITLKLKNPEKNKRPEILIKNSSESNLKNMGSRFTLGKGRKSQKKKNNVAKFSKSIDFQRNRGEETEEERRNAQTRTNGLLKASKRKSAQALHRNARRTNYPGNAADYTSFTSGPGDHGKHDYDSPFGSINSFASSIPSPRPLRFSQFGKRGKRKQFDSISMSSCMTSPCANDDYSPSMGFMNVSPRAREDAGAVSMPFTEDLRRRLLVVDTLHTPSSNAASPVLWRAFQPAYHHSALAAGAYESDDLLMIAPVIRASTSGAAWENTLEVIGEVAQNEKSGSKSKMLEAETTSQVKDCARVPKEPSSNEQSKLNHSTKNDADLSLLRAESQPKMRTSSHHAVCRSSSCPDVPISKITDTTKRNTTAEVCGSGDTKSLSSDCTPKKTPASAIHDPLDKHLATFQVENEQKLDTLSKNNFTAQRETEGEMKSQYSDLTQCQPSELAPLLQTESSDEEEAEAKKTTERFQ